MNTRDLIAIGHALASTRPPAEYANKRMQWERDADAITLALADRAGDSFDLKRFTALTLANPSAHVPSKWRRTPEEIARDGEENSPELFSGVEPLEKQAS